MTHARIYRPSKSAMTSGRRNTRAWVLEYEPESRIEVDPLMGWSGGADTGRQVRLRFASREDAEAYARRHGLAFRVLPERPRGRVLKTYAENFR